MKMYEMFNEFLEKKNLEVASNDKKEFQEFLYRSIRWRNGADYIMIKSKEENIVIFSCEFE